MTIKKIGVWEIEYPTTCNGRMSNNLAFIRGSYMSDFITLYGNGKYGCNSIVPTNKKVIKHLQKLSNGV